MDGIHLIYTLLNLKYHKDAHEKRLMQCHTMLSKSNSESEDKNYLISS